MGCDPVRLQQLFPELQPARTAVSGQMGAASNSKVATEAGDTAGATGTGPGPGGGPAGSKFPATVEDAGLGGLSMSGKAMVPAAAAASGLKSANGSGQQAAFAPLPGSADTDQPSSGRLAKLGCLLPLGPPSAAELVAAVRRTSAAREAAAPFHNGGEQLAVQRMVSCRITIAGKTNNLWLGNHMMCASCNYAVRPALGHRRNCLAAQQPLS